MVSFKISAAGIFRITLPWALTMVSFSANAEIVIDDFTTPGSVDAAFAWTDRLEQDDAALGGKALRILSAFALCDSFACPDVIASVETSQFSMTAANLPSLETRKLYSSFGVFYAFPTVLDLTEGGVNDVVRVDFSYSRGPTPFQNLRVSASTPETRVLAGLNEPFPITEFPFSRYLSMSDFRDRGDGELPSAFEFITALEFQFQSQGNGWFGLPQGEDLGWELGVRRVSVAKKPISFSPCDFDADYDCDGADLNLLYAEFGSVGAFDLDGSGVVDDRDTSEWLAIASDPSNPAKLAADHAFGIGDVNFDGAINSTDLGLLLNRFGADGALSYHEGNLNGDNVLDSTDLGRLLGNFGEQPRVDSFVSVPEPQFDVRFLVFFFIRGRQAWTRRVSHRRRLSNAGK